MTMPLRFFILWVCPLLHFFAAESKQRRSFVRRPAVWQRGVLPQDFGEMPEKEPSQNSAGQFHGLYYVNC